MTKQNFRGLLDLDLTLFDGAAGGDGAAGAAGAAGAEGGGAEGNPAELQLPSVPGQRKNKAGDLSKVVYGVQEQEDAAAADNDPAAGDQQAAAALPSKDEQRQKFQDLIKGEYKDFYTEETQRMIDRRFAQSKQQEAQLEEQGKLIAMMTARYGVTDAKQLAAALENDNAYWEQAAEDANMTVEQFKEFQKLRRDNQLMQMRQQADEGRIRAEQQVQAWVAQTEQLKQKYPDFDLEQEMQASNDFTDLLKRGISVEQAFTLVHHDEIVNGVRQSAAVQTEKTVVDNIRSKGMRPAENGTSQRSAFTHKTDVSKLTREDRKEIAERVARGARVVF